MAIAMIMMSTMIMLMFMNWMVLMITLSAMITTILRILHDYDKDDYDTNDD